MSCRRKAHRKVQVGDSRIGFWILLALAIVVIVPAALAVYWPGSEDTAVGTTVPAADIIIKVVGQSSDPTDQEVIKALGTLGRETVVKEVSTSDMMVLLEKDGSVSLVLPNQAYRSRLRSEVFALLLYHEMVHLSRERQGIVDHTSYDSWMAGELAANEAQVKFTEKLLVAGYNLAEYRTLEEENLLGGEQGFLVDLELYRKSPVEWRQMITARYERVWTSLQEAGRSYQAP